MPRLDTTRFKIALLKAGMSQGQLAAALGMTQKTLSLHVHGHNIKPEKLEKLCTVLRVRPEDITV